MSQIERLIWIDLEMTGLDTDHDHIIEIATIVTDTALNIVDEGPVCAIHQADSVLEKMDSWNTHQHTESGLYERVQKSTTSVQEAETITLDFLRQYVAPKTSPMCGNTICQDRRFLHREMPALEQYFHYRNLDVTSLKILAQLWQPEMASDFCKTSQHLALQDIRDSIDELRHYRQHFLQAN